MFNLTPLMNYRPKDLSKNMQREKKKTFFLRCLIMFSLFLDDVFYLYLFIYIFCYNSEHKRKYNYNNLKKNTSTTEPRSLT